MGNDKKTKEFVKKLKIETELCKEMKGKETVKKRRTKMSLHIKEYQKIEQLQGKREAKWMRARVSAKKQESKESE